MPCIRFDNGNGVVGIMTVSGPDLVITAGGKDFTFEMHSYCGPSVLGKRGDPLKNQPGERSPFWLAVQAWEKQGKRVVDGRCVWDMPKPSKVVHLGGRHYEVVEHGDDWYDRVEIITRTAANRLMKATSLSPLPVPEATANDADKKARNR